MDSRFVGPTEEVLEETRRLKRLARGLLYDRELAGDVVQEAWIALMRGSRDGGRAPFAWLAEAVRRIARGSNRRETRVRRREEAAARPEELPSTVDSVARVESLRSLVDAVSRLDEPSRQVVLMRFFDELPPREIAKRLDLPVETVRTRIKRGLAKLRGELDGEHSDSRGMFLAALLPLAGKPPWALALGIPTGSSIARWTGAYVMSKKIPLAAFALVLLVAFAGFRALNPSTPESSAEDRTSLAGVQTPRTAEPEPEEELAETPVASARSAVAGEPQVAFDWSVGGHLTRGVDDPFPHGEVRIALYEGRVSPETATEELELASVLVQTDEAGNFTAELPTPTTRVTVIATTVMEQHYTSADWSFVRLGRDGPRTLRPRAYPKDCEVTGLVVDPGGRPVAGAKITTYFDSGTTDHEGRFRVACSSASRMIRGKVLGAGFPELQFSVPIEDEALLDAGKLVLERGLRLAGRVVDEDGAPVSGAVVSPSWLGYGKRLEYATTETADDGSFELDQVEDEERLSLSVLAEGYAHTQFPIERERVDEEHELVLPRGGVVRGVVVNAQSEPIDDAWVCVGFSPSGIPRVDARSNSAGEFELTAVPSGKQLIHCVLSGHVTVSFPIEVPSGGAVLDSLELRMETGHSLAGVVVDEHGAPLPWVYVYVEGRRRGGREAYVANLAPSDAEGKFRVEGLPEGPVTLGFLEGGYSRYEETFQTLDRDDLRIQLTRAGKLAGRVVDGNTGKPLESFTIRFVNPELEPGEERLYGYWARWSDPGVSFTGTDGEWFTDGEDFESGKWVGIEARAEGYGPTIATRVQSAPEFDPDALILRMFPGGTVEGTVVDQETGLPVAGASVRRVTAAEPYSQRKDEYTLWTETDPDGRFLLEDVPAGEMWLVVEHTDHVLTKDGPFEVLEGGGRVTRRVTLGSGSTVEGRVLAPDGSPVGDAQIELTALETSGQKWASQETRTLSDGSFRIDAVLPGTYYLRWTEARGRHRCSRIQRVVEVREGASNSFELALTGSATLSGTLRIEGEFPDLVTVLATLDGENHELSDGSKYASRSVAAFVDGPEFRFEGLEPGEYSIHVFGTGDEIGGGGQAVLSPEQTQPLIIELQRY